MSIFNLKSTKKASFSSILAIFALFFIISTQMGCSKSSGVSEQDQIASFVKKSTVTYISDPSGLMYQIISEGSGTKPRATSTISATYKGTFLNGTVFDERNTPIEFPLNGVIQGWQIGLQKIAVGGEMKMIIPSALGYGPSDYNGIPGGSPLYFEVKLVSIKTY
jgi:FKBP-type peptidyl-prolyl cis-trans isomerase